MKKIFLVLLLTIFLAGCSGKYTPPAGKPMLSKYEAVIYINTRYESDEKFKAYVMEEIKHTGYLKVDFELIVRLHKTFIGRAVVTYKRKK